MTIALRPVIIANFSPPTLACIRSWGKQGARVGLICIQSERASKPNSKYLTDFITLQPSLLYRPKGIKIINKFLRNFRATGFLCINEGITCWINDHRQTLPKGVAVWMSNNNIIKNTLSKKKQIETAESVGLKNLPTYIIEEDSKIPQRIKSEHFPLCLRPSEPGSVKPSFKVHIVYSRDELTEYLEGLKKTSKSIIAQPFMNLPNLVVHGARTQVGKTIGMQAFLVERKFEGVTLTIRPTDLDDALREKCIAFTDAFEIVGTYHFEFLFNPKNREVYFLEINNRLGGTTAKVLECGYDEPQLALQSYGIKQETHKKLRHVTVSSKQALLKYVYCALTNQLTPLDYPDEPKVVRVLKTLWGLLLYKDDVFSFMDLKGSMAMYLGNLRAKLKD